MHHPVHAEKWAKGFLKPEGVLGSMGGGGLGFPLAITGDPPVVVEGNRAWSGNVPIVAYNQNFPVIYHLKQLPHCVNLP